jgi:hypothetical protein
MRGELTYSSIAQVGNAVDWMTEDEHDFAGWGQEGLEEW